MFSWALTNKHAMINDGPQTDNLIQNTVYILTVGWRCGDTLISNQHSQLLCFCFENAAQL